MNEFEALLCAHRGALERFVYYRLPSRADADDVIQEAIIAAYRAFGTLRSRDGFKAWLISIARTSATTTFVPAQGPWRYRWTR